jgi:hypothetical protein
MIITMRLNSPAPNIKVVPNDCEVLNMCYFDWDVVWFLSVPEANLK